MRPDRRWPRCCARAPRSRSRASARCIAGAAAVAAALALCAACLVALRASSSAAICGAGIYWRFVDRDAMQQAFAPRTTAAERRTLVAALRILSEALRRADVTYFLYAGSLLGSYRHHGLVPWDDDVDILANFSQIRRLTDALGSIPGYQLYTGYPMRYKFYPIGGDPIGGKEWKWPYVDVCFFGESATHVFDIVPSLKSVANYPKSDVFPLVNRPYEDLMLPAPRNSAQVVQKDIGDHGQCVTNSWSHRSESDVPWALRCRASCSDLYDRYSFVFRDHSDHAAPIERLRLGNESLSTFAARP